MPLTATDWTVDVISRSLFRKQRVSRCKMTLATAGTYPSGGIPIPTGIGKYGLKRKLDYIKIYDTGHGSGHQVKLSATGNVLRIYQVAGYASTASSVQASLVEMATTATAGSGGTMVLYVEAVGF